MYLNFSGDYDYPKDREFYRMKKYFDAKFEQLQEEVNTVYEEEDTGVWLKTTDVCNLISCSPATVGRLRDEGILKSSKVMGTGDSGDVDHPIPVQADHVIPV
jgi:hypothetical protein